MARPSAVCCARPNCLLLQSLHAESSTASWRLSTILSTHQIAVLAAIATFFAVGWLVLKILHKFEQDFPNSDAGVFVVSLLFSVVILAVTSVDYLIEGRRHHDLLTLRLGFGFVWLALFLGLIIVIRYIVQTFVPNRTRVQNVVAAMFVLGAFVFSAWAFSQIFGY
jgi:hypothetical protein